MPDDMFGTGAAEAVVMDALLGMDVGVDVALAMTWEERIAVLREAAAGGALPELEQEALRGIGVTL